MLERHLTVPAVRGQPRRRLSGVLLEPLIEALSKLTLAAELLAHEAGQTLSYQELNANREILRVLLERERPRWGEFVQA